jgi:hypothetical protein
LLEQNGQLANVGLVSVPRRIHHDERLEGVADGDGIGDCGGMVRNRQQRPADADDGRTSCGNIDAAAAARPDLGNSSIGEQADGLGDRSCHRP